MSVYVHKKTRDGVYSYDFQLRGRRFQGSTGKANRRDAEQEERRIKDEVRREIAAEEAEQAVLGYGVRRLTVEQACARYWDEKRHDHVNADDLLTALGWLKDHFEANTMLDSIDDARVARMVAARRGEPNRNFKRETRLIANGTVNKTTKVLQWVMTRARDIWKVRVQSVTWRQHRLDEPQERVREASPHEESAMRAHLSRGYEDVQQFVNRMGARLQEVLNFEWAHVNWFGAGSIILHGKGDRRRVLPMPPDIRALLWALKGHHPVKVFTFVAERTRRFPDGTSYVRGERYPMTRGMLKYAFRQAARKAGVADYRFHDGRHTAATRLLRSSGNLRLAQKLLGHANITTTAKYAHAMFEDLAAALAETAAPENTNDATNPGKIPGNAESGGGSV